MCVHALSVALLVSMTPGRSTRPRTFAAGHLPMPAPSHGRLRLTRAELGDERDRAATTARLSSTHGMRPPPCRALAAPTPSSGRRPHAACQRTAHEAHAAAWLVLLPCAAFFECEHPRQGRRSLSLHCAACRCTPEQHGLPRGHVLPSRTLPPCSVLARRSITLAAAGCPGIATVHEHKLEYTATPACKCATHAGAHR